MPSILEPFPRLPEELVKLIFECACEPIDRAATHKAVYADTSTLQSLLLVSRATYSLLIPRLYRNVTLSRPSRLIAFTETLLHRPTLGLLVRNLWVGTLDSPQHFLPNNIGGNTPYAVAARNHITRWENITPQDNLYSNESIAKAKQCQDLPYLENGAEYAAMHVQSMPTQMTQPRPPPFRDDFQEDWYNIDSLSTTSSVPFGGFGVDRESAGYDAAGDWIGIDEWMLRCIELQNMIEFHWEWVKVTCSKQEQMSDQTEDEEAKANDPMDWAEASQPPAPLPSVLRRDRNVSLGSAATSDTNDETFSKSAILGFDHLSRFSLLRQRGYSPRIAAGMLIQSHLRRSPTTIPPRSGQLDTLSLLNDSSESDHFSHPALYARSGAIDLLLGTEPPEGENAPPNAIPASSAAFTAFGGYMYSSDDESESDDDLPLANGQPMTMEGRQRIRERNVLDFADLYGHVSHDSRALYGGQYSRAVQEEDLLAVVDQTVRNEVAIPRWEREQYPQQTIRGRPLPTLGSLLATMRACLSFCPRVRVLGLNGFLERVVGGTRECVGLSDLRHLSLGPPPPYWSSALNLNQKSLSSVRTLHISGCMLFKSEAMAIGGYTTALPNLREMNWTLWLSHAVEHPIDVVDTLRLMLSHGPARAGTSTPADIIKRKRPLKKIQAMLNAEDVAIWKQGTDEEVKRDTRLQLQECNSKEHDVNLVAVRDWWERKSRLR